MRVALGQLRHALTTAGGIMVSKGLLDQDEADLYITAVGLLVAVLGFAWSAWEKKHTGI